MGRLAIGIRAFGKSSGFEVNVFSDTPGPHRMRAWKPGGGIERACGMLVGYMFIASKELS